MVIKRMKVKEPLISKIPLRNALVNPKEVNLRPMAFLLSDHASYITGETLKVNGGMYHCERALSKRYLRIVCSL